MDKYCPVRTLDGLAAPHDSLGVFRAASFWAVRDGWVVRGAEYWTILGADPRRMAGHPGRTDAVPVREA